MITTREIISLLVGRVANTLASDLIKECINLGMRQVSRQDISLSSNLPSFEAGHHFRFNPDGYEEALFEILEKDTLVLQAGYQLALPTSLFFSKAKKRHSQLKKILETHYGAGLPMNIGGIEIINYGNDTTIAYLSRSVVAGTDAITVRVGNRRFWD
ncbi:MAG: hypothetical protein QHH14_10890 [Clostridiales bacterium]|nr:hypothetical protein [Clostridiales bacterium]